MDDSLVTDEAVSNLSRFMLEQPDSPYRVFGSDAAEAAHADAELIATIVDAVASGTPVDFAQRQLAFLVESLRSRGLSADLLIESTERAANELGVPANAGIEAIVRKLLTLSYLETWQPAEGLVVPDETVTDLALPASMWVI